MEILIVIAVLVGLLFIAFLFFHWLVEVLVECIAAIRMILTVSSKPSIVRAFKETVGKKTVASRGWNIVEEPDGEHAVSAHGVRGAGL